MTALDTLLEKAKDLIVTHPYFSMEDQILFKKVIAVAIRQANAIESLCFNQMKDIEKLRGDAHSVAIIMRSARADCETIAKGEQ